MNTQCAGRQALSQMIRLSSIVSVGLVLSLSSCSTDMFSGGSSEDQRLKETSSSRKINPACENTNLSSSNLDVPTFRQVMNCLHNETEMPKMHAFLNRLTDEQLAPIVDFSNREVLNQPRVIYEINKTYEVLAQRELLDAAFTEIGTITKHPELFTSLLSLTRSMALVGGEIDSQVLFALREFGREITEPRIELALEIGLIASTAKVYGSIFDRLRPESKVGVTRSQIARSLVRLMNDPAMAGVTIKLLREIESGKIIDIGNALLGLSSESLVRAIPRMGTIVTRGVEQDGQALLALDSLFTEMNRPLQCMRSSVQIPNAIDFALGYQIDLARREGAPVAASFLQRDAWMYMRGIDAACSLPAGISRAYPAVARLASTEAIFPTIELLDQFDARGLRALFIDLVTTKLSDGSSPLVSLLPVLTDANSRGLIEDALLFATLLPQSAEADVREFAHRLLMPRSGLGGRSLVEVMFEAGRRVNAEQIDGLLAALDPFIVENGSIIPHAFDILRSAYFSNNVHPLVQLMKTSLVQAPNNSRMTKVLLEASAYPELAGVIAEVSQNAQNRKLRQMVGTMIQLFSKFGEKGQDPLRPILALEVPVFHPNEHRKHDLARTDLQFGPWVQPARVAQACWNFSYDTSLMDWLQQGVMSDQLTAAVSCMWNSEATENPLLAAMESLLPLRNPLAPRENIFAVMNRSANELADHLVRGSFVSPQARNRIRDHVQAISRNRAGIVDGVRFANVLANHDFGSGPMVHQVFQVMSATTAVPADWNALLQGVAKTVDRDDAPAAMHYGYPLIKRAFQDGSLDPVASKDQEEITPLRRQALGQFVERYECSRTNSNLSARIDQIVSEYKGSVSNWELEYDDERTSVRSPRKMTYSFQDIKSRIGPMLARSNSLGAQQSRVNPEEPAALLEANLNVMKYFTRKPGTTGSSRQQFTQQQFLDWFMRKSQDARAVLYYQDRPIRNADGQVIRHEPELLPRVRLATTLDRMELVTISGDMKFIFPQNFGMGFLSGFGEAWGDESWDMIPEAIRVRFPRTRDRLACYGPDAAPFSVPAFSDCAPRLRDMYTKVREMIMSFTKILGSPDFPQCGGFRTTQAMDSGWTNENTPEAFRYEFFPYKYPKGSAGTIIGNLGFLSRVAGGFWRLIGTVLTQLKDVVAQAPHGIRAGLFNSLQTLSVIEENLPDRCDAQGRCVPNVETDVWGKPTPAIGMKIMRNIFFEIYYATPDAFMTAEEDQKNNMRLAVDMVRFGTLRILGNALRDLPADPAAPWSPYTPEERTAEIKSRYQLVVAATDASWNRELLAFAKQLTGFCHGLSPGQCEQNQQKFLWKLLSAGHRIWRSSPESKARLQQTVAALFRTMVIMQSESLDITTPVLHRFAQLLRTPELRSILECSGQEECLELDGILDSKLVSRLMRSLNEGPYEADPRFPDIAPRKVMGQMAIDLIREPGLMEAALRVAKQTKSTPARRAAIDALWQSWAAMDGDAHYQSVKASTQIWSHVDDLVEYMVNDSLLKDHRGAMDPRQLRLFLAAQLRDRQSSSRALMEIFAQNPNQSSFGLSKILQSTASDSGEFDRFLRFVEASMAQ